MTMCVWKERDYTEQSRFLGVDAPMHTKCTCTGNHRTQKHIWLHSCTHLSLYCVYPCVCLHMCIYLSWHPHPKNQKWMQGDLFWVGHVQLWNVGHCVCVCVCDLVTSKVFQISCEHKPCMFIKWNISSSTSDITVIFLCFLCYMRWNVEQIDWGISKIWVWGNVFLCVATSVGSNALFINALQSLEQ